MCVGVGVGVGVGVNVCGQALEGWGVEVRGGTFQNLGNCKDAGIQFSHLTNKTNFVTIHNYSLHVVINTRFLFQTIS